MKSAVLAALALLTVGLISAVRPAFAGEDVFLARFGGSWSGSGTVQKNAETNPWHVNCRATVGHPSANQISLRGICTAALIVSRDIGAALTYDPASGIYRGVYTGATVGPARLVGKRAGNRIDLTITWPKPVNGDTTARMIIFNEGNGSLRIVVSDKLAPGGPVKLMSNISFRQS